MESDAPSAAELEAHPVVRAAFAAAWADSFPDDPALRHEEGGFIHHHPSTGDVVVRRVPPGEQQELNLSWPPDVPGYFLVATYHTHPNPVALGWNPEPSDDDQWEAERSGVAWFVVSETGVFLTGPDRRVGGLSGPPGYPI